MQKITPFLWFDNQAEEAMKFYTSIFKDAKVTSNMPGPNGKVMAVTIVLNGQELILFNGGPEFKFTEAVSLFVSVETQEEVDELWGKFLEGGEEKPCGWIKDKYGLFWQIIPTALGQLISDPDPIKSHRVIQAMLKMTKISIADLQKAHDQE